jgi:hypothetical protein
MSLILIKIPGASRGGHSAGDVPLVYRVDCRRPARPERRSAHNLTGTLQKTLELMGADPI